MVQHPGRHKSTHFRDVWGYGVKYAAL